MMASPAFPVEDQTDEDFFDKLVDDGPDCAGSEPSLMNSLDANDVHAFGNLSVEDVGSPLDGLVSEQSVLRDDVGESDDKDEGFLCENVGKVDNADGGGVGFGSSELVDPKCVTEVSDHVVGSEGVLDSVMSSHPVKAGRGGIKEVQWSAFGGGPGESSYSDFFNQFEDDSADPFGEVTGGFAVASDTAIVGSSNQDNCSSSYNTLRNEENLQHRLANQANCSSSYNCVQNEENLQHGLANQANCSSSYNSVQNEEILQHGLSNQANCSNSYNTVQNEGNLHHGSSIEHSNAMQEPNSIQYWENLYPGWKYDLNTGQWLQLDGTGSTLNNGENNDADAQSTSEGYYLQQTAQSVAGSITEKSKTGTLTYWNQTTQGSTECPAHMVFDPQYPGWYYDTIALEWRSLDSYTSSINQSASLDQSQQMSNGSFSIDNYSAQNMDYGQSEQDNSYPHQQDQLMNMRDTGINYHQQDMNTVQPQPELFGKTQTAGSAQPTYSGNGHMSTGQTKFSALLRADTMPLEKSSLYEEACQGFDSCGGRNGFQGFNNGAASYHNFAPAEHFSQHNNQHYMQFNQNFSATNVNSPEVLNFSQQPLQSNGNPPCESSNALNEGRSSAGRPPHALVAFGFGGKLVVMKDQSRLCTQPPYVGQDSARGEINVLNVIEVATQKSNGADIGFSGYYFRTLCQHSLPGPLSSGNAGSKELNKWIDDRIANCGILDAEYRKGETEKILFFLLKIACQYYGKLRSAFSADLGLKEHDCPESAVAKLFASVKRNDAQLNTINNCLRNIPSERHIQTTADEVQMLLLSGRRMEALQCAQEGHLWGPAIVIAALLGEQFYGETVKQMALHQLAAGSPLRTLCLILAGQPAEVFANPVASNPPYGFNVSQPVQGSNYMLDAWEENLAIITANRTKGDELVITHLGDCLWKERSEVTAAHICYLVAEANIESYSDSARLCLIGADHLKYPRTYAHPEAILRTELYEYAKVLGNSQFILLPFQPYKIIYAGMLAEVGRLTDALKYCQAVLKFLKAGRSPEVDTWRQMASSLEERIKLHLQGGYATNLAPAKLVGKLLHFFDNTAQRVVSGLPPPAPSTSHSNGQYSDHDRQSRGPRVLTSQSTMAIPSLIPSASMEGNTRKSVHNRSMSEPDIGRTPAKVDSPDKSDFPIPHSSTSTSGGSSRIGRFGSQIFQKTVGLVLRSRSDRQAKLGEKNKFYYDEKLKRWVEEGAEPPAEEPALAPPPTAGAFMNGKPDLDKKSESANGIMHANGELEFKSSNHVENHAQTPPIPSASNQFSTHGRMGVRARYVDTFNKGGGYQASSFQSPSPSVSAAKPAMGNAKFFIPTPVAGGQDTDSAIRQEEAVVADENTTTYILNHSFSSPQMLAPQPTMHRHPSIESIPSPGTGSMINGHGPPPPHSRRTLSWSGTLGDPSNPGDALGFLPSTHMPSNSPSGPYSSNCTMVAEDLQEVEF